MARGRWLTPETAGASNVSRCLSIPVNLQPMVNGALESLCDSWNWEQAGALSVDDTIDALRVALDAYYASGDCDMALFPDRAFMFWIQGRAKVGTPFTFAVNTGQQFNTYFYQQTAAQNDEIEFKVILKGGTYDLTILGATRSDQGIQHWIIDGVEDAETIDMYMVGAFHTPNKLATISVVLVGDGEHLLSCKISTKNPSATNYYNTMTWVKLVRTGD